MVAKIARIEAHVKLEACVVNENVACWWLCYEATRKIKSMEDCRERGRISPVLNSAMLVIPASILHIPYLVKELIINITRILYIW